MEVSEIIFSVLQCWLSNPDLAYCLSYCHWNTFSKKVDTQPTKKKGELKGTIHDRRRVFRAETAIHWITWGETFLDYPDNCSFRKLLKRLYLYKTSMKGPRFITVKGNYLRRTVYVCWDCNGVTDSKMTKKDLASLNLTIPSEVFAV